MSGDVTWLLIATFTGPADLDDDRLGNLVADAVAVVDGDMDDLITGNVIGEKSGSIDDAFDAARGYLSKASR